MCCYIRFVIHCRLNSQHQVPARNTNTVSHKETSLEELFVSLDISDHASIFSQEGITLDDLLNSITQEDLDELNFPPVSLFCGNVGMKGEKREGEKFSVLSSADVCSSAVVPLQLESFKLFVYTCRCKQTTFQSLVLTHGHNLN